MLWVSEHGRIHKGDQNRNLDDGDLQLCSADFNALMTLLDDSEEEAPDYEPIFKYSQPYNRPRLTVQNYVGVIRTERETQIEILPKIARRGAGDATSARDLLKKMLSELEDSPFREGTAAELEAIEMPLFEFLMRLFVDQVVPIVRKGIARTYVPREDNLVFLRGKIQLPDHIRRNATNSARVYCAFDEYETNRPINRLIKGALEVVAKHTNEVTTQQRCRELLFWFDDVPATKSATLDYQRVQRDRFIQHYMPAMPACMMILEHLNPLTQEGDRQAISMLFPMEKVFEDFVSARLSQELAGWRVRTQVGGHALIEAHRGGRMFRLRPDLELKKKGGATRVIADVKWKLIDEKERSSNYKISQSDIYQLYGYLKKYLVDQNVKEVCLIYPKTEAFTQALQTFCYSEPSEKLFVIPYDLEAGELLIPEESALYEPDVAMAV